MSKRNLVLVSCGSFNPITQMHLRIFELARDALRRGGKYDVIGGIMSPTHDLYKKQGLVESKHRVKMCELGTQSSEWIRVSKWESEQDVWSTTITVLKKIEEFSNTRTQTPFDQFPASRSRVGVRLLCGADLMESFNVPGLWKDEDIENIVGQFGLVVITRAGSNPQHFINNHHILNRLKDNIEIVKEWIPNEISATKIRQALKQGESIKYLVPDPVVDYIKKHDLYTSQ